MQAAAKNTGIKIKKAGTTVIKAVNKLYRSPIIPIIKLAVLYPGTPKHDKNIIRAVGSTGRITAAKDCIVGHRQARHVPIINKKTVRVIRELMKMNKRLTAKAASEETIIIFGRETVFKIRLLKKRRKAIPMERHAATSPA